MSRPGSSEMSLDTSALSTPEELIDDARNGRMFILVDDEDRENEGDLVAYRRKYDHDIVRSRRPASPAGTEASGGPSAITIRPWETGRSPSSSASSTGKSQR